MLADRFSQTFRDEHRAVRDALFDLIDAFRAHDRERAASLVGRIAALTGPHFRYEEETMYPALVDTFGAAYVDSLLDDHDGAIAGAQRLAELVSAPIGDEEADEGATIARSILPHVSDCDGLSIMVERLDDEVIRSIFDTRQRSLAAGLDLLTWARDVRRRPVLSRAS